MLHVAYFIIRHLISFPLFITSWISLQLGANLNFFIAGLISAGVYALSVNVIKSVQSRLIIKKYNMTLSEYKHVQQQLKEAKLKLNKLNGYFIKVRSIRAFKQLFEMNRLAKRIFQIVRTNPKKFYHVEPFFYAHLETAVELTEKYTLLVSQPVKAPAVQIALQDTRETLLELNQVMENDLHQVLASDIEHLKMELDFAKISIAKHEKPLMVKGDLSHDGKSNGF